MKRRILFWSFIGLVVVSLTAYRVFSGKSTAPTGRSGRPSTTRVDAIIVRAQPLEETIHATGSVLANEEVELRSEISGRITGILFSEGRSVKRGELLVKLNDADLVAQLDKLEARKKVAESQESRQRQLREQDLQSQEVYDAALNELQAVKADIEQVRALLAKTEIRAPFDGQIGLRYVSVGSYISPTSRVASLQNLNALKIDFSIPEKYASRIRSGQTVRFTVPGGERPYEARIFAVEPKIDPTTRTLPIRAVTTDHDSRLFPGAFADIVLTMKQTEGAILIPTAAVVPELKGQRVWRVRGGKAESVPITIGVRTESLVQVTSGLSAGDTLVVTGILQLRPGSNLDVRLTEVSAL